VSIDDIQMVYARSLDDVLEMFRWLGERRDFLAVDVETEGLNVAKDRIRLFQLGDHERCYVLDWNEWRGACREAVARYDRPIVAHNLLFDSKMLKWAGVDVPQHLAHDSMVMAHLVDSSTRVDLKGSAARYVDKRATLGQRELRAAMAAGGWSWATVPIDHPAYWQYAAMDTCFCSLLASALYPTVSQNYARAYATEMSVIHCIREAEIRGMKTDPEYRERAKARLRAEVEELRAHIPIDNPGSDAQVIEHLQSLGVVLTARTEAGNLSVDKDVLRGLAPSFPVCTLVEQYRLRVKLLGSYMYKLDDLHVDDVVHCNTRPLGAKTGRQSVTDPALQTLPRGRIVRDAFVARPGSVLVLADFKAMEMRALASLAREQGMLEAFARGEDLHDFVARSLYGDGFTKKERTVCKGAGFAKVYGAGVDKFARTAGISVPDAETFLLRYNTMFPGVDRFMAQVVYAIKDRARDRGGKGYVRLVNGRILNVEADKAYKAVNWLIQGSCAVSTKEKIVELDSAGLGEFFRLSVHDELIYECPVEDAAEVRATLERIMPDRDNFPGVVLEVDTDVVERWGQHYDDEYEKYVETTDPEWLLEARANPGLTGGDQWR
jgi:DNA polymerase I